MRGLKRPEREVGHSSPFNVDLRMSGPITLNCVGRDDLDFEYFQNIQNNVASVGAL